MFVPSELHTCLFTRKTRVMLRMHQVSCHVSTCPEYARTSFIKVLLIISESADQQAFVQKRAQVHIGRSNVWRV